MEIKQECMMILEEISGCIQNIDTSQIDLLIREIPRAKRIFCIGIGRSGFLIQTFCMRLNHLGFHAYLLGGVPCPPAEPGDLIIAASGSGETLGIIAVLQKAQQIGAKIVIITATTENSVFAYGDIIIQIRAPSGLIHDRKQSDQPMRTLFEQTAFIVYESIVLLLKNYCNITEEEMAQKHANLE
jgi:6-phospho-3-hexuloisomerase